MADRLVIDTFNVLHVTGVLPPELADILARLREDVFEATG